jgi:hypothetical protein
MIFHVHKLSRVFTLNGKSYMVCLRCGEEIELSDEQKRIWNVSEDNGCRANP